MNDVSINGAAALSRARAEDVGLAVVTVTRTGGSDGAVSVQCYTSDDTAFTFSDYSESTGTLLFAKSAFPRTRVPFSSSFLLVQLSCF